MKTDCERRMKVVIEAEIDQEVEATEIELLLRDALGEFIARRTPAVEYVERRYFRPSTAKVEEVLRRVQIAKNLMKASAREERRRDEG